MEVGEAVEKNAVLMTIGPHTIKAPSAGTVLWFDDEAVEASKRNIVGFIGVLGGFRNNIDVLWINNWLLDVREIACRLTSEIPDKLPFLQTYHHSTLTPGQRNHFYYNIVLIIERALKQYQELAFKEPEELITYLRNLTRAFFPGSLLQMLRLEEHSEGFLGKPVQAVGMAVGDVVTEGQYILRVSDQYIMAKREKSMGILLINFRDTGIPP